MSWRVWTALVCLLMACDGPHGHPHNDHGDPHDDHGEAEHAHGHDDEALAWTDMSRASQVHLEWPKGASAGKPARVLIHATRVGDWEPVHKTVAVTLSVAGQTATAEVSRQQPGIFWATLTPPANGPGTLSVTLSDDVSAIHRASVVVGKDLAPTLAGAQPHAHADEGGHADEAGHADHDDEHGDDHGHEHGGHGHAHAGAIAYPLEQQWTSDFLLRPAIKRTVRPSFEAYGQLRPRMGGEGVVHAATSGRVYAESMPALGSRVERGQTLAWLMPSISDQGDFASLDFATADARVRVRQAEAEVKRLEGLVRDGVVPAKRLTDAQFEYEQARASQTAADQRSRQARGITRSVGKGAGSVPLVAPIAGVVVGIDVPAGLFVESGQALFRIVDPDPIWLEVQVPEAHVSRLSDVSGVWFTVEGFDNAFSPTDPQIATGGILDPHSRTLPLIVTVPNPKGDLRPGMFANVNVIDGAPREAVAVPLDAVVLENGVPVAYAMVTGETFERRAITLGQRDGNFVEILEGISEGDWIVTQGAYAVRLASLGEQEAGHGHAH